MTTSHIDSFLRAYTDALRDQNAAVFAGAGLSIPAGLVDWRGLLADIANDVGLDVSREDDLIAVAQFHVNERGGRHRINQALLTEFAERAQLSDNHRLLAALPIRTYWTTNYDTLIEQALREAQKRPDVKATVESLATTLPRRDAVVYKMHGDIANPDKAVVTKDDYEAYESTRQLFSTALQGDLVSKTFLFLGFSFSDPNLSYILARIRLLLGANRREHYCLVRRLSRTDFDTESDFSYATARQDLQVRDLRRYGIQGVVVDSYATYTEILRTVLRRYNMRRVFVSGSATDYAPWTEADAQAFVHNLATGLIRRGYNLVSGFGLGIGASLLNGALDELGAEGSYQLDDRVLLRPFPQGTEDPVAQAAMWQDYRRSMLKTAGVAIFVFGNKLNRDDRLEPADGVAKEFELAREAGLRLIPVGATGSAAETLHAQILAEWASYYPESESLRTAFEALGQHASPVDLAQKVAGFLDALQGEQ